jgi:transcriptional regulator with PAS, ATPase and Fis domain
VTAVGDTKSKPVDIRVLCATNRDLQAMVKAGTFREDLYYRLNVIVMQVPPLRARLGDVADLAQHFLNVQAEVYEEPVKTLSPDAARALSVYVWPGNVRELANVMEHAHVLARAEQITLTDLPLRLQVLSVERASDAVPSGTQLSSSTDAPGGLHLATVERRTIAEALRRCRNNKAAASRMLGINIQRLNRRILHLNVLMPES